MTLLVHIFQVKLEFEMLVFVEGGKPDDPDKKPLEQSRKPKTNSTHMWPQWWEASTLTNAPSLVPFQLQCKVLLAASIIISRSCT